MEVLGEFDLDHHYDLYIGIACPTIYVSLNAVFVGHDIHVIMELSSSLSISDFASEHVVNVYDVPEEGFISLWTEQPEKVRERLFESELKLRRKKMDILFDQLKSKIGPDAYDYLSSVPHIVQGGPDREIPRVAKEIKADLVVMGTVARTGIKGVVIGNTAESILSQLECSVLAVKPKAFVSPISI